jgi:hypothetical protein
MEVSFHHVMTVLGGESSSQEDFDIDTLTKQL